MVSSETYKGVNCIVLSRVIHASAFFQMIPKLQMHDFTQLDSAQIEKKAADTKDFHTQMRI